MDYLWLQVPLMMERYKPAGWLGMIMGARLY